MSSCLSMQSGPSRRGVSALRQWRWRGLLGALKIAGDSRERVWRLRSSPLRGKDHRQRRRACGGCVRRRCAGKITGSGRARVWRLRSSLLRGKDHRQRPARVWRLRSSPLREENRRQRPGARVAPAFIAAARGRSPALSGRGGGPAVAAAWRGKPYGGRPQRAPASFLRPRTNRPLLLSLRPPRRATLLVMRRKSRSRPSLPASTVWSRGASC